MALLIGLTGGIGSGKSTVARLFEERGAGIIDTDAIARELTQPGGSAIPAIRSAFGDELINTAGALDRAAMRRLAFARPEVKSKLESILHPRIRKIVDARVAQLRQPYGVLVVPLLIESGAYRDRVARVLVVDCEETLQLSRTMARSGLSEVEVRAIMRAQATREARLGAADDVIQNNGDLSELTPQVDRLHVAFLDFAAKALQTGV